MAIKDTLLAFGLAAFGGWLMKAGIDDIRAQNTLEKQGITVQGELQKVEVRKGIFPAPAMNSR